MKERVHSANGNDILGNFYENNFYCNNSEQAFTPWPVCKFIAESNRCEQHPDKDIRILDSACRSGRMLLACSRVLGPGEYYGVDIDKTCVEMAALNLFLNGVFNAEVMCSDGLTGNDFRISYVTSLLPFGIFRIEEKEKSRLWQLYSASFPPKNSVGESLILPSEYSDRNAASQ